MPKRVNRTEQKRKIASAAIKVIHQNGLDRTRLREIASTANVTTGALMHYFDGKNELLQASLEEVVRRILHRMDGKPDDDAQISVAKFIERIGAFLPVTPQKANEWRVWLAFWGQAISDPDLQEIHQKHYQKIAAVFASRLQVLYSQDPEPKHLQQQADALLAVIDGIGIRATLDPVNWPPERQREVLSYSLTPILTHYRKA